MQTKLIPEEKDRIKKLLSDRNKYYISLTSELRRLDNQKRLLLQNYILTVKELDVEIDKEKARRKKNDKRKRKR